MKVCDKFCENFNAKKEYNVFLAFAIRLLKYVKRDKDLKDAP